jgi:serine/threonine-protein kinase RsbW
MGNRLSMVLPCDLRYRDAVGAFLQKLCRQMDTDPRLGFHVVSAFNEAFNNLVQHAYEPGTPGQVEIAVELSPDRMVIELRDEGRSFDLQQILPPDLERLPESGMGVYIMRSFMSELAYTPGQDGNKNVLRMVKQLERRGTVNDA